MLYVFVYMVNRDHTESKSGLVCYKENLILRTYFRILACYMALGKKIKKTFTQIFDKS